jgi:hypothetical protein
VKYSNSPGSLSNHLAGKHKLDLKGKKQKESEQATNSSAAAGLLFMPNYSYTSEAYKERLAALADFIVWDMRPPHIVKSKGFRRFAKAMNPRFPVPAHQTLTKAILRQQSVIREALKTALQGAPRDSAGKLLVSVTLDVGFIIACTAAAAAGPQEQYIS